MSARCLPKFLSVLALLPAIFPAVPSWAADRLVVFESAPAGARVELGDSVLCEATPCSVKLEDGSYDFRLDKDGYLPQDVTTFVSARRYKVRAALSLAATLDICVGGPESEGARIRYNGRDVGKVPLRIDVAPGAIDLDIVREGYAPYRQKFVLGAANTARVEVALVRAMGSLRVTSDEPRATVWLDGKRRGPTPLLLRVPVGERRVEVKTPRGRTIQRTLTVRTGEEHAFFAKFASSRSDVGGVAISANVVGAEVYLDGELVGSTPYMRGPMPPGEHDLRVTAPGHSPYASRFDSNADQEIVFMVELIAADEGSGSIRVEASIGGAEVLIDGRYAGKAPLEIERASLGEHAIKVRALGYADHIQGCTLERGGTCSVSAVLRRYIEVALSSNVEGSALTIDGEDRGELPFEGRLLEGNHLFFVEAAGHHPIEKDVHLGGESDFAFRFEPVPESEREKRRRRRQSASRGTSRFSGAPIAPEGDTFTVDASVTMPARVGVMANVGWTPGFSLGFGAQMLERNVGLGLVEFSAMAHGGTKLAPWWSAGLQSQVSMGSSFAEAETTAFLSAGRILTSAHLGARWVLTLEGEGEYFADRWETLPPERSERGGQRAFRILGGGSAVFWLEEEATALLVRARWLLDGEGRELYRSALFTLVDRDPRIYGQAGLVFRF